MRKAELTFAVLLVPVDYAMVLLAAISAYSLRFGALADIRPVIFDLPFREFFGLAAATATLFIIVFAFSGLYGIIGPRRLRNELSRVFLACSTAMMFLIATVFFQRELFSSRFIVIAAWILAILFVAAGRVIIRLLQRLLLSYGIGSHRIAVIGGSDRTTENLLKLFAERPVLGHVLVRRFSAFDDAARSAIAELAARREIDEIIVTDPDVARANLADPLAFAQSHHLGFKYAADLLATGASNIQTMTIAGIPMVEVRSTRLSGWGRVFKRLFDFIGASLLIIVTSPIMLVTAVAIVIDSGLPIFFRKLDDGTPTSRIGAYGKPFGYFKFRSMKPGTHTLRYKELSHLDTREGPLVKIKDDPRVTSVGKFIRKYSLDELPELFLVLSGEMSLVGPRPHLPEEVAKYKDHHRRVLTIKPGITGMAQVSGRASLDFEDEIKLDTFYIENWSPWLDLAILLKTPIVVFTHKGAS